MPMITRTNAEALIPEEVAREILSGVRKTSVAMQLMRRLPNLSTNVQKQPVLSSLPIADFVSGDSGMKVSTNAAWDEKQLVVGEIAAIVPIPQAVLDDASYDIWGETKPLLTEAIGRVFDNQVFSAVNAKAPTEWPQPIVTKAIADGNVVTAGTGTDIAEDINQAMSLLETNEYEVSGIAAHRSLKTMLRGLRNSHGDPIYQPLTATAPASIYGAPTQFIGSGVWNAASALAVLGDWNLAVCAFRQDITFKIFDTGVISDETGKVVYNLLQQDMVALRAVVRLAWQIANPVSIDRAYGTGYPFAVLAPKAPTGG